MCYSSCNYCDIRHKLVLTGKSYLNTIKTIFLTAPPYRALLYLLPYCGARFFIATANDILRSCHICGYKRLLCIVSARPVAAPLLWQRHNVYRPLAGLPAAHREKPFLAQGADNTFVYLVCLMLFILIASIIALLLCSNAVCRYSSCWFFSLAMTMVITPLGTKARRVRLSRS